MQLLTILVRTIALIGGSLLIYGAIFLYEDEQGKIQNTVEDLWIKINDRQRLALSRHMSFMRVLSKFMGVGLDRIFGKKLFSVKSIGVSICYSFASFYICLLAFNLLFPHSPWHVPVTTLIPIVALPLGVFLFLGLMPSFARNPLPLRAWFVLVILFGFTAPGLELLVAIFTGESTFSLSTTELIGYSSTVSVVRYSGIMGGVLADIVFISIWRWLLRRASGFESSYKILGVFLLNIAVAFVLFIYPLFVGIRGYVYLLDLVPRLFLKLLPYQPLSRFIPRAHEAHVLYFLSSNLIIAIITGAFVLLALTMIVHRLFWPFLERSTYALQRFGVARRSKLLGTIGIVLIGAGVGLVPVWLSNILNQLF